MKLLGCNVWNMPQDVYKRQGTKYLINEVSAKINFISGKLAGQQFELAKKGGYDLSLIHI